MENAILEKIILTAVGVIVPALLAWLGTQIAKYKKLNQTQENQMVKDTIIEALKPVKDSVEVLATDIGTLTTDVSSLK